MTRKTVIFIILINTAFFLNSCTAIDLSDIEDIGGITSCTAGGGAPRLASSSEFFYVLPVTAESHGMVGPFRADYAAGPPTDFVDYCNRVSATKQSLPPQLQQDPVVDGIYRIMVKTSGRAQLRRATLEGLAPDVVAVQSKEIDAYATPDRFTHAEVHQFAMAIFSANLRPAPPDASGLQLAAPTTVQSAAGEYFTQYYEGKFVDRFGVSISKPSLSTTVTDAQITAAFTVLMEYVIDQVDPTPVFGDKVATSPDQPPSGTTFLPGGAKTNEPTVLLAHVAHYKTLQTSGCGVTAKNIGYLANLANAAGDRAAMVGGLVGGTPGGIEVGFGVLGKVSIGDNKTLGDLVTTAASRLATRATFAIAYASASKLTE